MTLKQRIKEVKKNWDSLPKAESDNFKFVIIAQVDNAGSYETNQECLGVRENGDLIWAYLSGCSCQGVCEELKIEDFTAKVFSIEGDKTVEDFFKNHACEPEEKSYKEY
jgi:hypothetical protein